MKQDNEENFSWVKFCETATVHGLLYMFAKPYLEKWCRYIWAILFLVFVGFTCRDTVESIYRYMDFKVETSMQYAFINELDFPSVTFCNNNHLKKDMSGSSDNFLFAMLCFVLKNGVKARDAFDENKRYCKSNEMNRFSKMSLAELAQQGLGNVLSEAAPNSTSSILECWWNGEEKDCPQLFTDHFTDIGWCFSFNPSNTLQELFARKIGNNTKAEKRLLTTKKTGLKSGARFLMNVDQENYCGIYGKYSGAGFRVQIHDPKITFPSFELFPVASHMLLSPGQDITVKLKPIMFKRYTENLGKCRNGIYMQNDHLIYDKTICFVLCNALIVYNQCKCFPNWLEHRGKFVTDNIGIKIHNFSICENQDVFCLLNSMSSLDRLTFDCPHCLIEPCFETRYDLHLSSTKYLSTSTVEYSAEKYSINETKARENIILFNVFFEDGSILKIVEKQAFDELDLCIYFGGIIGLYLGMSFTTLFEILYQFCISLHFYGHRLIFRRKDKVAEIHAEISNWKTISDEAAAYTRDGSINLKYLQQRNLQAVQK